MLSHTFPFHCWLMLSTVLTVVVQPRPYTGGSLINVNIPDSCHVRMLTDL